MRTLFGKRDRNRLLRHAVLVSYSMFAVSEVPALIHQPIVFAIPMKKDFADWRKCFYFVGANQNIEACYGF